jgi:hypothetical protein
MNPHATLEEMQRNMGAAVMQPLTADEQMQPTDTIDRWNGRSMQDVASEFIRPNDRLTAFERLEIYNRQYWFRLQTAFTEDFPGLRAVVGAERFESLMNAYLAAHPSRSFTLRNLGSKLVEWLRNNPQLVGPRVALALDVVRVEWACILAFDDAELKPLSVEEVSAINGDSKITLQPYIQLLDLDFPADDLVLDMHQQQKRESSEAGTRSEDSDAAPLKPLRLRKRKTWLAVHRADLSLYYKRLTAPEYLTIAALRDGSTLAESLQLGFATSRISIAKQIKLVQSWFTNWAELGWICRPHDITQLKEG